MTPLIKICGLTDPETACECAKLGADAIGFVFFKKSPRHVSDRQALAISQKLPDNTIPTGVFVNESYEFILNKVDLLGLKAVQLHGHESPGLITKLSRKKIMIIKALFAAKKPYFNQAANYNDSSFFLVEYGKGVLPGGTAETWDYGLVKDIIRSKPIFLAGGLNLDNIETAVNLVKPFAVDVSSGVERKPGIKDLNKVEKFIYKVRSCY